MDATFNAAGRSTGHGEEVATVVTFESLNKPPDWESGVYYLTGSSPTRELWRSSEGQASDAFISRETAAAQVSPDLLLRIES